MHQSQQVEVTAERQSLNSDRTRMKAKIVGRVAFDESALEESLKRILTLPSSPAYADYAIGNWRTISLWNRTGHSNDAVSVESDEPARPTELGVTLPYLNQAISQFFITQHIRSVRIFAASMGSLIIPHSDYLELRRGFTRIHLPVQVDDHSLNSEEEVVFRMRRGEVWFIDGRPVHSGGQFSPLQRLLLVVDCDPAIPFESLFRSLESRAHDTQPVIVDRPQFTCEERDKLTGLMKILIDDDSNSWREVVAFLARVHFRRDVSARAVFDWLDRIAQLSSQPGAVERAMRIRRFFILDGPGVISSPWM